MRRLPVELILALVLLAGACEPGEPQRLSEAVKASPPRTMDGARSGRFMNGKMITDTFQVRHHLAGDTLTLVLDTDLPDDAHLMVGIHRIYNERGSTKNYVNDYYSRKSSIGAWRRPRQIVLDAGQWHRALDEKRRIMAAAGEPFEVGRISDDVVVSFVVPVNQDDSRFGKWNANLVGQAVDSSDSGGMHVVSEEIVLPYPLTGSGPNTQWADPRGLLAGKAYVVESRTPLVPEFDPPDPMAAIAKIKYLPAGTRIAVAEVRDRRGEPWYRAAALSGSGEALGSGWVNSSALIGQNIREAQ